MFAGKAAVDAGGSRGIGRALVLRLARGGAEVLVNYARSRDAADEELLATAERQPDGWTPWSTTRLWDTDLLNAANGPEKLAMDIAMTSLGRLGRPERATLLQARACKS
ncbi:hypothetical protein G3I50_20695 [Streptomyces parvus]|uniref:SDR family NAD(P)-dependent oxidoreductase n=1 Tax=Streptomyces parvus TaxID=66428 RepID=A0A7K3RZI2_9ACTN|nr:hypothetical protein [Streptomyces parvus]NEC20638.1 hypothetical protein [Streptomyces parvus]